SREELLAQEDRRADLDPEALVVGRQVEPDRDHDHGAEEEQSRSDPEAAQAQGDRRVLALRDGAHVARAEPAARSLTGTPGRSASCLPRTSCFARGCHDWNPPLAPRNASAAWRTPAAVGES